MLHFETYYHIYNHANGDENLFREGENYRFFLDKYRQYIALVAETVAWCLMPNHFHLLVRIKKEEDIASAFPKFRTLEKLESKSNFISKQFARFFSSYTQAFNKVYRRRGSLFMKNFKRKPIDDDEYLTTVIIYIHINPIKHGFTQNITSWNWTSYHSFPQMFSESLVLFFDNLENYEFLHQERLLNFNEYDSLEYQLT